MSDEGPEPRPSFLDRIVDRALGVLGSLGFNATRLRWRWNNFRGRMRERRTDAGIRMRGVTARHRMCPQCRALTPSGSRTCSECGSFLEGTSAPGPGRLLQWLMPGLSPVSAGVVTANFLIFFLIAARAGFAPPRGSGMFGTLFGFMGFSPEVLIRYGAGSYILLVYRSEWWRLITPIFLHAGLLHLLFNAYIFVQIAPLLEEEYGRHKLLVCYMTAGIGSFVASELIMGHNNTVGASGAIFGLVGAALVFGTRRGGAYGASIRTMMIRWAIYFLVLGFVIPGTDNAAHIGGLAVGAAFAAVVPSGPPRSAMASRVWRSLSLLLVTLVVVSFLFAGAQGLDTLDWIRQHGG